VHTEQRHVQLSLKFPVHIQHTNTGNNGVLKAFLLAMHCLGFYYVFVLSFVFEIFSSFKDFVWIAMITVQYLHFLTMGTRCPRAYFL